MSNLLSLINPYLLVFTGAIFIFLWTLINVFVPNTASGKINRSRIKKISAIGNKEKPETANREVNIKKIKYDFDSNDSLIDIVTGYVNIYKNNIIKSQITDKPYYLMAGQGLLFLVVGFLLTLIGWSTLVAFAFSACAFLLLPVFLIRNRCRSIDEKFIKLFPDAIDLIVRSVKSGLPVADAINTISEEMEEPISTVFNEINAMIRIGVPYNEALPAVAKIVRIEEFNFFVTCLTIQQETGGNLAELLSNLADIMRKRQQLKLKIRAMSSEARASATIIGALPFVMGLIIYAVNPDYLSKLFEDTRGIILLSGACFSLLFGLFVINRMIKFEV